MIDGLNLTPEIMSKINGAINNYDRFDCVKPFENIAMENINSKTNDVNETLVTQLSSAYRQLSYYKKFVKKVMDANETNEKYYDELLDDLSKCDY